MGGFNNNPNVTQFRAALRKLLVKQCVTASKSANSLDSEMSTGVFTLKARSDPVVEISEEELPPALLNRAAALSVRNGDMLKENILYYITGFIVRTLRGKVACQICCDALTDDSYHHHTNHQYNWINRHSRQ